MKTTLSLLLVAAGLAGCHAATPATQTPPTQSTMASPVAVPLTAEAVHPLQVGQQAPTATVCTADGKQVEMAALYARKPSVVIFYRGGWCPYCNAHLGQIAKAEPELVAMGYQVLAVSPDKPESLKATLDKGHYTYELLSDSEVKLISAFGLAFHVDDPTVEKYRGFGIDLNAASGRDHHVLPVPAVYIVDAQGVIRFAHFDPDYKKRLSPDELIAAARSARAQ